MDELRFGWIGHRRRSTLESLLTTLLDDWLSQWWQGYASATCVYEVATELDAQARLQGAFVASSAHGALAIHAGTRDVAAIGRHLAQVTSDDDDALAAMVGTQALNALAALIHSRAGAASCSPLAKQVLPVSLAQARVGAFALSMQFGRLQLIVMIDRALGERLAPPAFKPSALPLTARRDALAHATLRVTASLHLGEVDLAQLSDLTVGEVLVADQKLDAPLQLLVENQGAVATGYLRRSGNQRAIVLDGATNLQVNHHD